MNILQIFKPIMGLFVRKPVNTVLRLPEPLKIVVKRIHINNCKAMMVAKDQKKNALTVYVPSPDSKMDVINTCLLIVVAWTVILGTARFVWLWIKNRLMSMRMGQEEKKDVPLGLQACKGDDFFDCQSREEIVSIDFDEKIIFFDVQPENVFQNDSTGVFFNVGSDKKEAVINLESQEKNEFLGLKSDEKNGFIDSPSYEDLFSDLPSDEEERLLNLKSEKKGFLDIPSDEERIPSLPPDEKENVLSVESEEKVLPDFAPVEKGSPDLPSDEVELIFYLEPKKEGFPDLSSDEEETFPTVEYEKKDLPSDLPSDKVSSDLLSDEVEFLLYSESKKKIFPDFSSDEEERFPSFAFEEKDLQSLPCLESKEKFPDQNKVPDILSEGEDFRKDQFPDLLSNDKEFSDMTSDEQEIFLYFKSKEKWFPDLPSDEEKLLDLPSEEGLRDLPTNQEGCLDLPGNEEERFLSVKSKNKAFPDLPSDEKMEDFPVRYPSKSYSIKTRPFKMKASSTRNPTLPYSKR